MRTAKPISIKTERRRSTVPTGRGRQGACGARINQQDHERQPMSSVSVGDPGRK